jgi:PKD repeat protein
MKSFSLLALSVCFSFILQAQQNVLFLGNSYTGSNNLSQIVEQFSQAGGQSIVTQANAPGGFTLQGHTTNMQTLSLLQQGNWDFVVLQEQSQLPSFPISQVQTQCFPYAAELDSLIHAYNSCANTMFFMTWGRENGDASNCASWPPVCTYQGMDSLLYERYMQMGADNQAMVSPVGAVWNHIRTNNPSINLYSSDGSHPSASGSYAAACTFYSVIFQADPSQVNWDYSLTAAEASVIRDAAKAVVFDSLSKWGSPAVNNVPVSQFSYQTFADSVEFTNNSLFYTSNLWSFGDGDTSTQVNPTHVYDSIGTFNVTLYAYNCGFADLDFQMLNIDSIAQPLDTTTNDTIIPIDTLDSTLFIKDFNLNARIQIFQNPADQFVRVSGILDPIYLSILSLNGALIGQEKEVTTDNCILNIGHLPKGFYLLKIRADGESVYKRILKE